MKGCSKSTEIGNIVAVHWKDKRDEFVVSAIHGSGGQHIERRGKPEGIEKPDMIVEYSK